jgi:hypothetical protein
MYDVVGLYLTDEAIRHVAIWTLSVSALIIFLLAFAVTEGAGFHGPLALLKGAQRFILCALSIACAYAAACIIYFGWTPPGPILILFVAFSISTTISAVRHLLGPALAINNTWKSAWTAVRAKAHGSLSLRFGLAVDAPHRHRRYPF